MREQEGINPLLATPVCPLDQPEASTPEQARRGAFVYSFKAWEGAILPPAQHTAHCEENKHRDHLAELKIRLT